MTEILLGGSLLPSRALQLWAGALTWSRPGQAGENSGRDSIPAPAAARRKPQGERTTLAAGGDVPCNLAAAPPDAPSRGWQREYVSSHCWFLIQDCKRYKFVSVIVILAGERGSSSVLFYTYIFWTPTESY